MSDSNTGRNTEGNAGNTVGNIKLCTLDSCARKLGLIPFQCRCTGNFCKIHRMPETHACEFDFKTSGRAALQRENCVVVYQKIGKI
uniref:AN1-type domain-containing protein n=1 Tax=viral metagenome TaxID=1070528 RepID=A0A6C0HM42_9ZZZZ